MNSKHDDVRCDSPCITLTPAKRRLRALCSTEWIRRRGRNDETVPSSGTQTLERGPMWWRVKQTWRGNRERIYTVSISYLYSPAVRTSTLSRMDSKRVVARYPCIMIISHLDTLNPAPCHRTVASCTIFLCLALFHPARHRLPRPQPTFTASFLLRSNLRSNPPPTSLPRFTRD